ncbi:ORF6N domain-containing protein [Levilactobacillus brevis]|uniref:ORF6N domain-containing protein n=1 Tax=Levilactobacillus brevis TaxID=1580 RepID=UPI00350F9C31
MNELKQVKFNNELILTTEQLADFYGTTSRRITDNFNANRTKFVEGTHYFHLEGDQLKAFKNQTRKTGLVNEHAGAINLWTKRGASRHSKMLGTNQAWDMFDQLEENYFNPKSHLNTSGLSPELQFMQGVVDKLAASERTQHRLENKIDGVSEIVATSTMDWRNETSHLISKIARQQGNTGESYKMARNDIYDEVDRRGGVSLKTRLTNLRRRMAEEGTSKTQRKNTTKVDVIAHDKKLIEIYTAIVKEFAIRYQVWNEEY